MNVLIQVTNQDGDHIGLYETERKDNNILLDVENCFKMANEIAKADQGVDGQDAADVYLEEKGITRVFAEEAFVTI
jgi:hypothetical protein